jgi:hypothetical protein
VQAGGKLPQSRYILPYSAYMSRNKVAADTYKTFCPCAGSTPDVEDAGSSLKPLGITEAAV